MKKRNIWVVTLVALLLLVALGAWAAEQEVEMEISGMTCSFCALAIRKSLSAVKGVGDVKVSYKEKKARFTADETISNDALMEAVKKAGSYRGKVVKRKPIP